MTRFARAKGSKSSNLKAPEDSTPWEVMKEQITKSKKENEDCKHREEAEKQRLENYNNFLKEQKVQKRKATWCDFPETKPSQTLESNKFIEGVEKKKKDKKKSIDINKQVNKNNSSDNSTICQKLKKKKKKMQKEDTDAAIHQNQITNDVSNEKVEKKKHKKQKKNLQMRTDITNNLNQNEVPQSVTEDKSAKSLSNSKVKKSQRGIEKLKQIDHEPKRRKPIQDRSFQIIINGKEVELVRFDGFPIIKKDAERLQELKNSMIKKGIPKSEVQRTIKLERRRAEKALARLKRDVCYNCRKGGHNLSDCPDLKSKIPGVDGADGVCFKCGSTEHRQFECKVQRDKEFRFATCFICKEAGHIARQCPDNPKGLYPNGGSCKLCGDVTHLRKDCPTVNHKKEESSIKLQMLDTFDNIEDIGQKEVTTSIQQTSRKPKKIKF